MVLYIICGSDWWVFRVGWVLLFSCLLFKFVYVVCFGIAFLMSCFRVLFFIVFLNCYGNSIVVYYNFR